MDDFPISLYRINPAPWLSRPWRLALGAPVQFDWYVDSVGGNDANTGKSPSQAFQTIGKLLTVIGAGDRIALRRGSEWNAKLTIQAGTMVGAYGSGAAPVIECRAPVAGGAWSKTAGLTNVYEASITFDPGVTDAEVHIWEDGVPHKKVASTALCDAEAGTYYIASSAASPQTIYIHAYSSTNPTSDGKTRLYSKRAYGIGSNTVDNCIVRDVHIKGALGGAGCIALRHNTQVINCTVEWGGKHNMYVGYGSRVVNCNFYDALHSVSTTMLVFNADTPNGQGGWVTGCTFKTRTEYPFFQNVTPVNSHNNVSGSFGTITFERCTISGMNSGAVLMNHCDHVQMDDCTWVECKYGFSMVSTTPTMTISGGSWTSAKAQQRIISQTASSGTSVMRFENFAMTASAATDTGYFTMSAQCVIELEGCSFTLTAGTVGTRIVLYGNSASADLSWNNCTFTGDLGTWHWVYLQTLPTSWSADNNRYMSTGRWNLGGSTYTVFGDYQAAAAPNEASSAAM